MVRLARSLNKRVAGQRPRPVFHEEGVLLCSFPSIERPPCDGSHKNCKPSLYLSLSKLVAYCNRARSLNCRAVASKNVSILTPSGASKPDFAWSAAAILL